MKLIFKTLYGSRLYGTNNDASDIDLRGVVFEDKSDLIGFSTFNAPQTIERNVDEQLYSLRQFALMAIVGKMNAIELLFTDKEFWVHKSNNWIQLHEMRYDFLSQEVYSKLVKQIKGMHLGMLDRGYNTKDAAHVIRHIYYAYDLLELGYITPTLTGSRLNYIKSILPEKEYTENEIMAFIASQRNVIETEKPNLPDKPNAAAIEQIIWDMYINYLQNM